MRIAAVLSPVYAEAEFVAAARAISRGAGRDELEPWAARGVDRVHVSLGSDDMERRLEVLAEAAERVVGAGTAAGGVPAAGEP